MGEVIKRIKNNGISARKGCYNSINYKSIYEVEYPDGKMEQPTARIIAENILSQVVTEGFHYYILTEFIYYKRDGR